MSGASKVSTLVHLLNLGHEDEQVAQKLVPQVRPLERARAEAWCQLPALVGFSLV